jgi:hypothetical protein
MERSEMNQSIDENFNTMTSCHRPDALTGKTGAQAALCLLQSAGCRSIMKFKALNSELNLWTSTQYPQINAAYQEIINRYYWNRDSQEASASDKRAARRGCIFISIECSWTNLSEGL